MIKLTLINISGELTVYWIWKKDIVKLLKVYQLLARICWGLVEVYENHTNYLNNNLTLNETSTIIIFFSTLLQNKQKPIRKSFRSKLSFTLVFPVSFKFQRLGWNQRLIDSNGTLDIETGSCFSCLVLSPHG